MARRLLGLITILLTAIVGVVAVPAVAPAGAAVRSFSLSVPQGEGILQIRDADEAQELGVPTTVTGSVDDVTGVISDATLSTPSIEFDTVALGLDVHVTATFSQVAPGTGLVSHLPNPAPDGQGSVTLRSSVIVDLVLEIGDPIILEAHCVTNPVSLEFLSEGPYTEADGGLIVDPNFTVPPVEVNNAENCISQVADGVNNLLAGPGHSLSMHIEGDLPVPPRKEETTTTLSVDPSAGSLRGSPVTLTAAVAEVEANPLDPTGSVVFREDTKVLGTADLQPDGTATLTTTELRAGNRTLTAAYQGDVEFAGSVSPGVPYTISPAPIITGSFPEFITRGAAPVEFDLAIDNSASSRPLENGRVDIVLPGLNTGNLVLERQLPDTTWVAVPMPYVFPVGASGTLGPANGVLVAAGAVQNYHLRVSAPGSAAARHATIEFSLVSVDPDTGDEGGTVATAAWPFNTTLAARAATTTFVGVPDVGLRPGHTLYVEATVSTTTGTATTGQVEFLIDGQVMPFSPFAEFGPLAPKQTRATIDGGVAIGLVTLPSNISTGPHVVTARYLGDSSYLPSISQQHVLTINDPLGPLYTCDFVSVIADQFGSYVQAYVRLPAYAEDGDELDLEDLDVTVVPGGLATPAVLGLLPTDGTNGVNHVEIDLGDAGSAEGSAMEYTPNFDSGDQLLHILGLEGSIIVDGEPGEVMPLPIEKITMSGVEPTVGAQFTFTCLPQGEPTVLEEVGIAGVSLTAETTTDPVRVGDDVVLTATAAPAGPTGLIEFYAGSQSLGTASGATGTASVTVDDLPVGTNLVTARYTGVAGSPYQSNIVEIQVRATVECPGFTDEGNGAAVRLVYLELLQRCPDQAGYDYWVERLQNGLSREAFANTISKTFEARMVYVDKAYRLVLDRPAEQAGKAYWAAQLANGRYDRLIADLGASPEFWTQAGGTNQGFVQLVYERILGRAASSGDVTYWAGRLGAGESRRALFLTLFNLTEPLSKVVNDAYGDLLCRPASPAEKTAGVSLLRSTSNLGRLYGRIINTDDFFTRAQALPNPEDC